MIDLIGRIETLLARTLKIDGAAVDGLTGTENSVGYIVSKINGHVHNRGYWYGKDPGDAFLLENGLTSWQLVAGAGGAFGNWVQLSNGDEISNPRYDPHLIQVTQASASGKLYYIQFGTGAGGAQVVATTIPFFPAATLRQSPVDVICYPISNTALLWARCCCETDAATVSFVIGLHTYSG